MNQILRKIGFIFLLLFPLISSDLYAQEEDFFSKNRWKEVERMDKDHKKIAFQDTLFLLSDNSESFSIRKGGFLYKGTMTRTNKIDFGIAIFTITQEKNKILLEDQRQTHVFKRELKDLSAVAGTNLRQDSPKSNIFDPTLLTGKWFVYKRINTKEAPPKIEYESLIKSVDFQTNKEGTISGNVFTFGKSVDPKYKIEGLVNRHLNLLDQKNAPYYLELLELNSKEIIFIDKDGIKYFLKPK